MIKFLNALAAANSRYLAQTFGSYPFSSWLKIEILETNRKHLMERLYNWYGKSNKTINDSKERRCFPERLQYGATNCFQNVFRIHMLKSGLLKELTVENNATMMGY